MVRSIEVVGVPMDLGADRRGVDMGPSAIRHGGLTGQLDGIGHDCRDGGDIQVPRPEPQDPDAHSELGGSAKYLAETKTVCSRLADRVASIRDDGRVPLVLGGDHSIAIGTVNGVADEATGVLWFDAHADFNTPQTTPSGNVHGMPLAALLGKGAFHGENWAHAPNVVESNVALVGIRTLDEEEKQLVRDSDVTAFTMSDVDARGIAAVVEEAIEVATDGVEQLAVSLDLDFLDPDEAPGVGTPVRGGATYREAHAAMEQVHREAATPLCSLELVEVNPILDRSNRTAELACELAASAFGDKIL